MNLSDLPGDLACPTTHQGLRPVPLTEARARISDGQPLHARASMPGVAAAIGETDPVLLREDGQAAFPIVDGIPVLLAPETLYRSPVQECDLSDPRYAEAYAEMEFYNAAGFRDAQALRKAGSLLAVEDSESLRHLERLRSTPTQVRGQFPKPQNLWLNSRLDLQSEWDCYQHIGPVRDQRVIQLGGSGRAVQLFLMAGAREGLLLTPMIGEAVVATEVAKLLGVADRFRCIIGVAEEIPLADASVDVAFSGGCVHHMRTEIAFPEVARVLRPGGRFAAIEPWRAPLYSLGTRILGKREANPYCRPLTSERIAPLFQSFSHARYELHGTLTRYPMLGMQKFGLVTPAGAAWQIGRADDRLCSLLGLRRFGSGVAVLATK